MVCVDALPFFVSCFGCGLKPAAKVPTSCHSCSSRRMKGNDKAFCDSCSGDDNADGGNDADGEDNGNTG